MSALVVDTDVVSLGFRQSDNFVHHYGPALVGSRLIVSFMTIAELAFGALNRQWGPRKCQQLSEYMNRHYVRFDQTEPMCQIWAELCWEAKTRGRVLRTADGWVAATAVYLNLPLVTHNARDFNYLPQLQLITFPSTG
ncbi:PIN domain-containing protein [Rosistilla carotiformis]|uniref:Ribonuclease VapC1 n=1 Tax=Rosistilla carotiformis TaxID=2528017 RepID=A0A518JVU0_9BACT|nr:PIN domain-containing protein [Rosistilla carotiformis]QDV69657.1 Ribonuclease VapC1 [Rosistilla carotiformis]